MISSKIIENLREVEFNDYLFESENKETLFLKQSTEDGEEYVIFIDKSEIAKKDFASKFIEIEKKYCGDAFDYDSFENLWLLNDNEANRTYSEAIVLLLSISIIKRLKTRGEEYQAKYMKVLKQESQFNVKSILDTLEIDLFSEDLVNDMFDLYEELITKYEELQLQ